MTKVNINQFTNTQENEIARNRELETLFEVRFGALDGGGSD